MTDSVAHDSTARKMASEARERADEARKDNAVLGATLSAHLELCNRSSQRVEETLNTLRKLVWGLLLAVLAAGAGILARGGF